MSKSSGWLDTLEHTWRPVARLALYYAVLAGAFVALTSVSPWLADHLSGVPRPAATGLDFRAEPSNDSPAEAAVMAVITMGSALLLALPVVWVYTFARQKRGFQQSLAQTLVILPIVVAIVVVLVKHSVALAFSLGGIVGAVAFRHRLEDTKDAVYVFVTIALGLAVGVQAYSVALAASAFYNLVALGLWATDFARAPAPLAPEIAQRRVQLAKGLSEDRRTGDYVAQLDQHLLQSMTPDQLKALADRALQRNETMTQDFHPDPPSLGRDGAVIVVAAAEGLVPDLRRSVESVLEQEAKQWRFEGEAPQPSGAVGLRYWVRSRKRLSLPALAAAVRRAADAAALDVRVE
ncbi:MAG: DUF4956 domain-containing protein [Gemmatimonadetes bacterium]|nr:DUF4956 domain-containing protein [Gemmatimonadota bacterium]